MDDNWVALFGILCLFGLPIGGWITVRVLQHRERMAMLQRGLVPPSDAQMFRRGGRAWSAPPPGWNVAGQMPQYEYDDSCSSQTTLSKGIRTAMIGIAIFIGLSFIGFNSGGDGTPPSWHPGPWLLGGLVPMFVGFAQVIIALLSGAQFVMPRGQMPPNGGVPPSSNGPMPYGSPPQPGSPGPRYEELARPVPPPERK